MKGSLTFHKEKCIMLLLKHSHLSILVWNIFWTHISYFSLLLSSTDHSISEWPWWEWKCGMTWISAPFPKTLSPACMSFWTGESSNSYLGKPMTMHSWSGRFDSGFDTCQDLGDLGDFRIAVLSPSPAAKLLEGISVLLRVCLSPLQTSNPKHSAGPFSRCSRWVSFPSSGPQSLSWV